VAAFLVVLFLIASLGIYFATASFTGNDWQNDRGGRPHGLFFIIPLLALLAAFIVFRRLRRSIDPFVDLMEASQQVSEGNYAARVAIDPARKRGMNAQVAGLVTSFNAMAKRLESNDAQRRRLLADIAHEFRTPLSVIQGNIEAMLDGVYPRDDAHLKPLVDEIQLIARLLEDLQLMATVEGGSLKLHREPADLNAIVEDLVTTFTAPATAKGIQLASDLGSIPELSIDPLRIRQVIENLLSNALRFTPDGGTISITTAVDGDSVRVDIRDSGRGLSAEEQAHMFDRFVKAVDSGGSGLGLPIAKSLVEAHHGTISVESTPGSGTTVTFRLPID
jgi:two-component system sensor histidine kinase BaeS